MKLEEYAALLKGEYKEKFDAFRALLLEYNARYNLTTILEEKDMFYKHFLDSVAGEKFFPKNAKVIEIGSGAGFPSIPLKLLRDDLSFTLVESVGKKCEFLHAVVDNLGLSNVNIYFCNTRVSVDRFSTYTQILHIFIHRDLVGYTPLKKTLKPLIYKAF